MGHIVMGVLATLFLGGITFGILIQMWTAPERDRSLSRFFGFWVVAGLSGYYAVAGWQAIL